MNPENISDKDKAGGKQARLFRPSIVVLCGPAACGKSTFAERHFRPTQIISSDWARARVADDERDQRCNAQAFALVHFLIEQRLTVNRLCVVDSTALTRQARKDLLDLAKKFQVPTTLMLFNVPLETCIERDAKRERSVGRTIVERQYQAFEQSKETIRQEGFDQVVEIQEGDLEKVQIEILYRPVARPAQRPQPPDAGAPRRFERSAKPFRSQPDRSRDNRPFVSTRSVPPKAQPAASPRPATVSALVSAPKVATPQPIEASTPVAGTQPAPTVPPPAVPANANKPGLPPSAVATPKPAPAAAPPPAPAGTETTGRS
ncbi:MAG TPA: ATP-binding protein [Terriglobia bacterium]|nr:ATP-binding protein [Terriglobia bacterium]